MTIQNIWEVAKGVLQQSLITLHPFTDFIRQTALLPIASLLKMDLMILVMLISVTVAFLSTRMTLMTKSGKIKFTLISVGLFILLYVV